MADDINNQAVGTQDTLYPVSAFAATTTFRGLRISRCLRSAILLLTFLLTFLLRLFLVFLLGHYFLLYRLFIWTGLGLFIVIKYPSIRLDKPTA